MTGDRPSRDPVDPHHGDASARRVLRALADTLDRGAPVVRLSVLHDAVCDHMRALRARGVAAEVALIDVKRLTQQAINAYLATERAAGRPVDRREAEALLGEIPTWCLEEYFRR